MPEKSSILEIYEILYYTFPEAVQQFYVCSMLKCSMLKMKGADRSDEIIFRYDTDRDAVRI